MSSSLSSKVGLKEESRAYLAGAPREVAEALSVSGARFSKPLTGSFTFIQAFFVSAVKLDTRLPQLKRHLAEGGALWISWPKAGQESKTIGVDSTWSAIKFTHPKVGKRYRNSYGKLPSNAAPSLHLTAPMLRKILATILATASAGAMSQTSSQFIEAARQGLAQQTAAHAAAWHFGEEET